MNIKKNVSLASFTTFKTGGVCDYLCEIKNKKDLIDCFSWLKKENRNFFCLGGGSNIIVNDKGFSGVVIKIIGEKTWWTGNLSVSSSGKMLTEIISEAKEKGLSGLEWGFGIPATLGGAIKNNAGAFGFSISKNIDWVEIFDPKNLKFKKILNKDCFFSYRNSIFHKEKNWVIWEAQINWSKKEKKDIEDEIKNYLSKRREKQPLSFPSAGSFFKNPLLSEISPGKKDDLIEKFIKNEIRSGANEEEIRKKIQKNQFLPAAFFIEKAGLKGRIIGGAQVSTKHANFIINIGKAKTEDIIILSSIIKQKVRNLFGLQLREEVEYVGF